MSLEFPNNSEIDCENTRDFDIFFLFLLKLLIEHGAKIS